MEDSREEATSKKEVTTVVVITTCFITVYSRFLQILTLLALELKFWYNTKKNVLSATNDV